MTQIDELMMRTNASEDDCVAAFRSAFFTPPTLGDHFKPTPIAHFRSQMSWSSTEVLDSCAAARLSDVTFHRTLEDCDNWRFEVGETIAMTYDRGPDGATVRMWVDNRPIVGGFERSTPMILYTYAHEIFSQLNERGFNVEVHSERPAYKVPAGAPPGWPFPS
jgi:hypothetical protein